jgi:carbamate kinase
VRIVAALGGNALLERGETPDSEIQQHHVVRAVAALTSLCREHDVVITHGNGPQVGVLALESDADPALSRPYPLDVLGAQTQGMIGYWILQALQNAVPSRTFAALICQTMVRADDPAFETPSKFVGQVYSQTDADLLAHERGWQVRRDGTSWRRVVASPLPLELVELSVIECLLGDGIGVICAGGGGIPVVRDEKGQLRGVEAVVDKDRTAALLAELVGADALLLLTDVTSVEVGYGTPAARPVAHVSTEEIRKLDLPAGSMGPKVSAACDFVDATGKIAAIGRLDDAEALVHGDKGTIIHK